MLLRFEVSNHRSILEPVELSMIAVDEDRPGAREVEQLSARVLTVSGIYGPNASGKSNMIDSLSWLSSAVADSLQSWDESVPRDPFKFGKGPESPSTYRVEMVVEGVRFEYQLEVDDKVRFEGLYSFPERRRRTLFEREGDRSIHARRGLRGLSAARELVTPTTLVLSAAMRLEVAEVRAFARALAGIVTFGRPRKRFRFVTWSLFDDRADRGQLSLFEESDMQAPSMRASALALLRFADPGIDEVEIVEEEAIGTTSDPRHRRSRRLKFVHRISTEELPFDLGEESAGTMTWFHLIGPVLDALRRGRILLLDEIDASLHPRLSMRLIELFQDRATNPQGAQLIFTSHDTSLLNHLNRDEVWLTEKNESGATTLTALVEYGDERVRRSVNLERAYLQGRFGAVPDVDQYMVHRALGLIGDESE